MPQMLFYERPAALNRTRQRSLRGIDDSRVNELNRSGDLSRIATHLWSLGSLTRLGARRGEVAQLSDEADAIASSASGDTSATTH